MRGETVIRRRPSTVLDDWGNQVDGPTVDLELTCRLVAPGTSAEPEPGRGEVVTKTTLYFDPPVDTDPRDEWVVRGDLYRQDGKAAVWARPGRRGVVVVTLDQVEG